MDRPVEKRAEEDEEQRFTEQHYHFSSKKECELEESSSLLGGADKTDKGVSLVGREESIRCSQAAE
jgi:hypothetical protein